MALFLKDTGGGLAFDWGAVDASAPLRSTLDEVAKAAERKNVMEQAVKEKNRAFAFNVAKAEADDEFKVQAFNEQVAAREAGDIHRAKVLENQAILASTTSTYQMQALENKAIADAAAVEAADDTRFEAGFYKQLEIDAKAKVDEDKEKTNKQDRVAKQITIDADKNKKLYADTAAKVAGYTYDKQQEYLNDPTKDPVEKLAVRKLWSTDPSLYGEANNNNNYSVENQGTVDKFGPKGVPTLADEKTASRLSKDIMSGDDDISKKALNTAKKVIPNIDKMLLPYEIFEAAGALTEKLGYDPSALQKSSVIIRQIGNFYSNIAGKNTISKTNNDEQVKLLVQLVDSLPEHSPDRVLAEDLLFEAKETSLALGKGRTTISSSQINRRLKKKQYGLSATTRKSKKTKKQTALDNALKLLKNSNLTPEEVAKAIAP